MSVHKHITYLTLFEKSVIKLEQTITNVVLVQQCLLLRWCLKDGFGVYVLNNRCFEVSQSFLIHQNSSANSRPQFLLLLLLNYSIFGRYIFIYFASLFCIFCHLFCIVLIKRLKPWKGERDHPHKYYVSSKSMRETGDGVH